MVRKQKPFLKEQWWVFLILGITLVSLTGAILSASKDTSLSFLSFDTFSKQIPSFWNTLFPETSHYRTVIITPVREEKASVNLSPTQQITLSPTPTQETFQRSSYTLPTVISISVQPSLQTFNQDDWWKNAQEENKQKSLKSQQDLEKFRQESQQEFEAFRKKAQEDLEAFKQRYGIQ